MQSDTNISRHSECNEESQNRGDFTNNAILRGLNNCSPQKDGKNSCRLMRGDVSKSTCKVASTLAEGVTHVAHRKNSRKIAFTLAEVLITLGIIGVVAALTLYVFIVRHQDKLLVTRVNEVYNLFSNAFEIAQSKYDSANTWEGSDDLWFERITENLKLAEDCGVSNVYYFCRRPRVFPYKNLYNSTEIATVTAGINHTGRLDNGVLFSFHQFRTEGKWWFRYGYITVDINGFKGPNCFGKDVFTFEIADYSEAWSRNVNPKLLPVQNNFSKSWAQLNGIDDCLKDGQYCAGWVIEYGNVDYMHCRDKMLKNRTHSCKE